ncbi:hypothetical protein Hanom_Chr13g01243501 [Helianthus anomalus]
MKMEILHFYNRNFLLVQTNLETKVWYLNVAPVVSREPGSGFFIHIKELFKLLFGLLVNGEV